MTISQKWRVGSEVRRVNKHNPQICHHWYNQMLLLYFMKKEAGKAQKACTLLLIYHDKMSY